MTTSFTISVEIARRTIHIISFIHGSFFKMIINNEINNCSTTKDKSYSLIVNYLPQSIKENGLNEIFSGGQLKSCKLMQEK